MWHPRKILFLVLAVALLALGIAGFWRQAQVAALPGSFVPLPGTFPCRVEGIPVADQAALEFVVEGFPPGSRLELAPRDGSSILAVTAGRAHQTSYLVVALFSGLFFWGLAVLVFLPRLEGEGVPQFFWILTLYGLSVLVGGVYFQRDVAPAGLLLSAMQLLCLALLPVVFVHLSVVFPVRRAGLLWPRVLPAALYALAAALVLWQGAACWSYLRGPSAAAFTAFGQAQKVADLVLVVEVLLGLALFVAQERRLPPGRQQRQVRWLLLGFVLGASPYVFLRTLPQVLGAQAVLPAHIDRLFELAIPLCFVLAIVRHRFLDIDVILRRGILYILLAGAVVILLVAPVVLVGRGPGADSASWVQRLAPVAGGLAAGLLFHPLRHRLGSLSDRLFFKINHRLDQLAVGARAELTGAGGQEEVLRTLRGVLERALSPRRIHLAWTEGETHFREGDGDPRTPVDPWPARLAPADETALWAGPDATTESEWEHAGFPENWRQEDWHLAIPLRNGTAVRGLVLLGAKESGRRYVRAELDYLAVICRAAARRLVAIGLVQTVVEERLARQQLQDLGALKDEFLGRVAHDLRTPVTSLGWSLRNLLDGLAGELQPRQAEYLDAMNQSVRHLDNLVAGLLEISRLESPEVQVENTPTLVVSPLEVALGTVRPLAEPRGVRLGFRCPDPVPVVLADGHKLTEILVNLLANAVRYSPDGGEVELAVVPDGARVVITVRDHGPGFTGIDDPFARFAQGTPSPHGAGSRGLGGYGLGLAIARGYTELLDGEISARNHPQGGAEVRLVLPAARKEEDHGKA